MISRDVADQALEALGSAYERIAAAMFAIDSHPGLAFLKSGVLTGRTLAARRDSQARVDTLWAQFGTLRDLLEQARTVRGRRSRPGDEELTELTRLLHDPVVELDSGGMPLDGSAAAPSEWLRLDELAQRMEVWCADVTALLTEVESATSAVDARMAPVASASAELRRLADEFGAEREIAAAAEAQLASLGERALGDPLGAAAGDAVESGVRRLAADIEAARGRLATMARLRDELPGRVEALRRALDDLAGAEAATVQSYALVRAKIANPGLPPAPETAARLAPRLPSVADGAGPWARRAVALAGLEAEVVAATRRAVELRAAADGLIDRRGELRGRLDAYRAKAARLGYAEHPDLSAQHQEAKELLYTSPCDLAAATRAVAGYQRALAELIGERL